VRVNRPNNSHPSDYSIDLHCAVVRGRAAKACSPHKMTTVPVSMADHRDILINHDSNTSNATAKTNSGTLAITVWQVCALSSATKSTPQTTCELTPFAKALCCESVNHDVSLMLLKHLIQVERRQREHADAKEVQTHHSNQGDATDSQHKRRCLITS
jgi:hypothetical protein